jgi:hypothetical protein
MISRWGAVALLPVVGLACQQQVSVGLQGRHETPGQEGLACTDAPTVLYDAGEGFTIDRVLAQHEPMPALYVARRAADGTGTIDRVTFRFGELRDALTLIETTSPMGPFEQLGLLNASVYFTNGDTSGGAASSLNLVDVVVDADNRVTNWHIPDLLPVQKRAALKPEMLGFLDYGGSAGLRLAVASDATAGAGRRIDAIDLRTEGFDQVPSAPVVDGNAFATFSMDINGKYFSYAEATADGVILWSGNVQDPLDTTAVLLPDAKPTAFFPIGARDRALYFQYAPNAKAGDPVPSTLPLLRLDLGAPGLGRTPTARAPEIVLPAVVTGDVPETFVNGGVVASVSPGSFVWVSFAGGSVQPLPELAGAIDFAQDDCNFYWVTGGSSKVTAMPLYSLNVRH